MEVEDAVQEGCWYWRHLVEEIHCQLALWGSETLILKAQAIPNPAERRREIRLIEHATAVMGELTEDDLSFVHSGLCQTRSLTNALLRTMRFGSAAAAASTS